MRGFLTSQGGGPIVNRGFDCACAADPLTDVPEAVEADEEPRVLPRVWGAAQTTCANMREEYIVQQDARGEEDG